MRTSLFLFAIFAIFAIIYAVPNFNAQCQAESFVGACYESKAKNLASVCKNLRCASTPKVGKFYVPVSIGAAKNGTICGVSRMCRNEKCVPTLNVPHQVGPRDMYECK